MARWKVFVLMAVIYLVAAPGVEIATGQLTQDNVTKHRIVMILYLVFNELFKIHIRDLLIFILRTSFKRSSFFRLSKYTKPAMVKVAMARCHCLDSFVTSTRHQLVLLRPPM